MLFIIFISVLKFLFRYNINNNNVVGNINFYQDLYFNTMITLQLGTKNKETTATSSIFKFGNKYETARNYKLSLFTKIPKLKHLRDKMFKLYFIIKWGVQTTQPKQKQDIMVLWLLVYFTFV